MDMQKMLDTMSAADQATRAGYHVTLGKLIKALEAEDQGDPVWIELEGAEPGAPLRSPREAMSYRGYYSDLAFDTSETPQTVADVLEAAREVLGKTLQGYKGGNYRMDENVPIWISKWGEASGEAVLGIVRAAGGVYLMTRIVD